MSHDTFFNYQIFFYFEASCVFTCILVTACAIVFCWSLMRPLGSCPELMLIQICQLPTSSQGRDSYAAVVKQQCSFDKVTTNGTSGMHTTQEAFLATQLMWTWEHESDFYFFLLKLFRVHFGLIHLLIGCNCAQHWRWITDYFKQGAAVQQKTYHVLWFNNAQNNGQKNGGGGRRGRAKKICTLTENIKDKEAVNV